MGRFARASDHLVITADDFGMARPVNEAVEIAHRDGILTAASLMVAGKDAADAVRRAKRTPTLRVGLHLVLVEGRPVLSRRQIPDLVGADDRLRRDMFPLSVELAARPKVRRQLAAEIEAQFALFAASGLALDHVNAHKHFHLHPIVAAIVLAIGRKHGLDALRVPLEPGGILRQIEPSPMLASPLIEAIWARRLRAVAAAATVRTPDAVLGLRWSGAMSTGRLAGMLRHRPAGLTEIYMHPACTDHFEDHAPGYRYQDELAALCAPECLELAALSRRGGYSDCRAAAPSLPIFAPATSGRWT